MLLALSNTTYRSLLLAQVLSVLGSGLATIALGLLAYDLAGENAGAVLGTALALKMVAYVGLAPVAAALAVKLPRKPFLISLDCARAALVLTLPFVTQIWQIYVLIFAFQALSAAFTPSFQALIPDVLKDEKAYTQALSLSRLTYDIEALISPMLAGLLLSVATFHSLFAGTGLGFLASALLVAGASLPSRTASANAAPFAKRVTRGLWIYLATPRLRGMLALYIAVASATSMVIVNTVVLVKSDFGFGDGTVAIFFAASGAGSMLVAVLLPRFLENQAPRPIMLTGALLLGVALMLSAIGVAPAAALFLWFVLGAGASMIQTPSGLVITRSCHDQDRPAVFAAQFALSHSTWLIAYPLAGFVGAWLGLSAAFALMGALSVVSFGLALALWPARDPRDLEHEHDELEHSHDLQDGLHHDAGMAVAGSLHRHRRIKHKHVFIIDDHHPIWPRG
ncbi:MFS transporter [Roseibium porphyridii]|uniref:MFS transporter n=1 Tax=Roseibium porphyridii TaxID=2866279 RepID=A0ABY8FCJ0_9HYPH|nr:MFS transporter [Roseibium sp. KMA01]WFE90980.1 MFS transporter [Roseibium sp. KMA01]